MNVNIKCESCGKIEEVAEEFKSNKSCKECYKKQKNGKSEEKNGLVNQQTKVSIEISISRNYNKITFGIQDEPLASRTEEEFRAELKNKSNLLRSVAEEELKLINTSK